MDLKKKLALAMGAFVSMPVASVATACSNELTARRRLRRRRASVPVRIAPGKDRSLRINVQLPLNEARRVPAACNFYKLEVSLLDAQNGAEYIKIDPLTIKAGNGATFEIDLFDSDDAADPATVNESITVSASVEVTPEDVGSCATIKPVTSFVLLDQSDGRTFLPSRELDPVHLRPLSLGGPIIIKDPKNNN
jgi:hypothetical protein